MTTTADNSAYKLGRDRTGCRPFGQFHVLAGIVMLATMPQIVAGQAHNDAAPPWQVSNGTSFVVEALGDSITFGERTGFVIGDRNQPLETSRRYQGWPEILEAMLTDATGRSISVINEGHPGDRISVLLNDRLPAMFAGRPSADVALLSIGTIDSSAFQTTPSGEGCTGDACDGTLKGQLESTIAELRAHGRDLVFVGQLAPTWGADYDSLFADPLAATAKRNGLIREYNRMIRNEIGALEGVAVGPDLFTCFLSPNREYFSLFNDHLHPNALGNVVIASLWRDRLLDDDDAAIGKECAISVYLLEGLDSIRSGHKQNVLAVGDRYYTDESFVLVAIPDELRNGIWIMQANADKGNRESEAMQFDVGESPVTVYLAVDPSGAPPVSASHEFHPVALSSDLRVSDPVVDALRILAAQNVTGRVSLGGSQSGVSKGPQQAYTVVVVP